MSYRQGEFERDPVTIPELGTWYVQCSQDVMGDTQYDVAVSVMTIDGPVNVWMPVATTYGSYPAESQYAEALRKARLLSSNGQIRSVVSEHVAE